MKHIFLNLKSFFKHEKTIFILVFLCVVSSSFIINFSYGLFHNFKAQKEEADMTLKDIFFTDLEYDEEGYPISWKYIEGLTKKDLQRYIESLSKKTLDSISEFLLDSFVAELANDYNPSGERILFHFTYRDGKYGAVKVIGENIKKNGDFKGRYFTDEEVANGTNVAVIGDTLSRDSDIFINSDTIRLFGKNYEVIGDGRLAGELHIPFTSLPDNQNIAIFEVMFKNNISKSIYDEMREKADEIIPGKLFFPKLEGIDNDSVAVYNNMIVVSFIISVLSLINFALLYHFVIEKRQKQLAIMRICGCGKVRAVLTYFGECALITLPFYCIGVLLNHLLVGNVFNSFFYYIEEAYTPKVYVVLFAVYMTAFALILLIMITKSVSGTIAEAWKG